MPYWFEVLLWFVGLNWGAPLLLWLYPLFFMVAFKDFVWEGFHGPFGKFRLANEGLESWHAKWWKDWGGVGLYWFMCYRDRPGVVDDAWVERTKLHEGEHCKHWAILGLLFYAAYLGHSVGIWVTQKIKGKPYTKHAYLDNWSERLARKQAMQIVNIDPLEWGDGVDDLWPWW
jgi:hypothetical protein